MDTYHQLELVPLTEGAWRICDTSVDSSDAASVIAYVEQLPTDDRSELCFEVVWVQCTRGLTRHTSLQSVLLLAAKLLADAANVKPLRIAHFPPRAASPRTSTVRTAPRSAPPRKATPLAG
ncbi:hypothetical protein [Microbacterium stercoris]|uniref:Uncharacterized protein n=1 Tax=Microbacterium stercoris TaxID=2820289 RepID=A0A939TR02_9MICO|nr:hypothetical protein [Microbacterium stercoris]MBO3663631.1 hypothetical protein [Microbacterium stercoris]